MFSLIVFVHEAGHYTAARLCGMRVREFMIGLPGPNIGFTIGDTKYGVTPILLGGYALIAGMQFESESETLANSLAVLADYGELDTQAAYRLDRVLGYEFSTDLEQLADWGTVHQTKLKQGEHLYQMRAMDGFARGEARRLDDSIGMIASERKKTFLGASYTKRVIMLITGAVFNLAFAITVFTVAMMMVGDLEPSTTIAQTTEGSPAEANGVVAGDILISIDGQVILTWDDFYELIGTYNPGDTVVLVVERDEQPVSMVITLAEGSGGRAYLGVSSASQQVPVSFSVAFRRSVGFIGFVAIAIVGLFNPATFGETISQSSSVVGISVEASNAAAAGFMPFIILAAALSISIGLMNLLPLPPLDGGKIVLETIQRIIKRPIPMKIITSISLFVLVLFGLLFVVVTWQDIQRYILGG